MSDQSRGRRPALRLVILALVAAFALVAKLCFFKVETGEYAVVTEFGDPVQVVTSQGLGIKYPYQSVRKFDARLNVYTPAVSEFLTRDKTAVIASGVILWRIEDPRKYFETVFNRTGAESRLGDILFAELGAAIGRNPLDAFVGTDEGAYRAEDILAEVAEQHRGEGEAAAARIYAGTLEQAPEFYRFLRTLEASRKFVAAGTTLVLPANSELFGLLYDSKHYQRADRSASERAADGAHDEAEGEKGAGPGDRLFNQPGG